MDIQSIVVLLLFALAAFYLGSMLYTNLKPKKGKACGSNCKCGMDFSNLPEQTK